MEIVWLSLLNEIPYQIITNWLNASTTYIISPPHLVVNIIKSVGSSSNKSLKTPPTTHTTIDLQNENESVTCEQPTVDDIAIYNNDENNQLLLSEHGLFNHQYTINIPYERFISLFGSQSLVTAMSPSFKTIFTNEVDMVLSSSMNETTNTSNINSLSTMASSKDNTNIVATLSTSPLDFITSIITIIQNESYKLTLRRWATIFGPTIEKIYSSFQQQQYQQLVTFVQNGDKSNANKTAQKSTTRRINPSILTADDEATEAHSAYAKAPDIGTSKIQDDGVATVLTVKKKKKKQPHSHVVDSPLPKSTLESSTYKPFIPASLENGQNTTKPTTQNTSSTSINTPLTQHTPISTSKPPQQLSTWGKSSLKSSQEGVETNNVNLNLFGNQQDQSDLFGSNNSQNDIFKTPSKQTTKSTTNHSLTNHSADINDEHKPLDSANLLPSTTPLNHTLPTSSPQPLNIPPLHEIQAKLTHFLVHGIRAGIIPIETTLPFLLHFANADLFAAQLHQTFLSSFNTIITSITILVQRCQGYSNILSQSNTVAMNNQNAVRQLQNVYSAHKSIFTTLYTILEQITASMAMNSPNRDHTNSSSQFTTIKSYDKQPNTFVSKLESSQSTLDFVQFIDQDIDTSHIEQFLSLKLSNNESKNSAVILSNAISIFTGLYHMYKYYISINIKPTQSTQSSIPSSQSLLFTQQIFPTLNSATCMINNIVSNCSFLIIQKLPFLLPKLIDTMQLVLIVQNTKPKQKIVDKKTLSDSHHIDPEGDDELLSPTRRSNIHKNQSKKQGHGPHTPQITHKTHKKLSPILTTLAPSDQDNTNFPEFHLSRKGAIIDQPQTPQHGRFGESNLVLNRSPHRKSVIGVQPIHDDATESTDPLASAHESNNVTTRSKNDTFSKPTISTVQSSSFTLSIRQRPLLDLNVRMLFQLYSIVSMVLSYTALLSPQQKLAFGIIPKLSHLTRASAFSVPTKTKPPSTTWTNQHIKDSIQAHIPVLDSSLADFNMTSHLPTDISTVLLSSPLLSSSSITAGFDSLDGDNNNALDIDNMRNPIKTNHNISIGSLHESGSNFTSEFNLDDNDHTIQRPLQSPFNISNNSPHSSNTNNTTVSTSSLQITNNSSNALSTTEIVQHQSGNSTDVYPNHSSSNTTNPTKDDHDDESHIKTVGTNHHTKHDVRTKSNNSSFNAKKSTSLTSAISDLPPLVPILEEVLSQYETLLTSHLSQLQQNNTKTPYKSHPMSRFESARINNQQSGVENDLLSLGDQSDISRAYTNNVSQCESQLTANSNVDRNNDNTSNNNHLTTSSQSINNTPSPSALASILAPTGEREWINNLTHNRSNSRIITTKIRQIKLQMKLVTKLKLFIPSIIPIIPDYTARNTIKSDLNNDLSRTLDINNTNMMLTTYFAMLKQSLLPMTVEEKSTMIKGNVDNLDSTQYEDALSESTRSTITTTPPKTPTKPKKKQAQSIYSPHLTTPTKSRGSAQPSIDNPMGDDIIFTLHAGDSCDDLDSEITTNQQQQRAPGTTHKGTMKSKSRQQQAMQRDIDLLNSNSIGDVGSNENKIKFTTPRHHRINYRSSRNDIDAVGVEKLDFDAEFDDEVKSNPNINTNTHKMVKEFNKFNEIINDDAFNTAQLVIPAPSTLLYLQGDINFNSTVIFGNKNATLTDEIISPQNHYLPFDIQLLHKAYQTSNEHHPEHDLCTFLLYYPHDNVVPIYSIEDSSLITNATTLIEQDSPTIVAPSPITFALGTESPRLISPTIIQPNNLKQYQLLRGPLVNAIPPTPLFGSIFTKISHKSQNGIKSINTPSHYESNTFSQSLHLPTPLGIDLYESGQTDQANIESLVDMVTFSDHTNTSLFNNPSKISTSGANPINEKIGIDDNNPGSNSQNVNMQNSQTIANREDVIDWLHLLIAAFQQCTQLNITLTDLDTEIPRAECKSHNGLESKTHSKDASNSTIHHLISSVIKHNDIPHSPQSPSKEGSNTSTYCHYCKSHLQLSQRVFAHIHTLISSFFSDLSTIPTRLDNLSYKTTVPTSNTVLTSVLDINPDDLIIFQIKPMRLLGTNYVWFSAFFLELFLKTSLKTIDHTPPANCPAYSPLQRHNDIFVPLGFKPSEQKVPSQLDHSKIKDCFNPHDCSRCFPTLHPEHKNSSTITVCQCIQFKSKLIGVQQFFMYLVIQSNNYQFLTLFQQNLKKKIKALVLYQQTFKITTHNHDGTLGDQVGTVDCDQFPVNQTNTFPSDHGVAQNTTMIPIDSLSHDILPLDTAPSMSIHSLNSTPQSVPVPIVVQKNRMESIQDKNINDRIYEVYNIDQVTTKEHKFKLFLSTVTVRISKLRSLARFLGFIHFYTRHKHINHHNITPPSTLNSLSQTISSTLESYHSNSIPTQPLSIQASSPLDDLLPLLLYSASNNSLSTLFPWLIELISFFPLDQTAVNNPFYAGLCVFIKSWSMSFSSNNQLSTNPTITNPHGIVSAVSPSNSSSSMNFIDINTHNRNLDQSLPTTTVIPNSDSGNQSDISLPPLPFPQLTSSNPSVLNPLDLTLNSKSLPLNYSTSLLLRQSIRLASTLSLLSPSYLGLSQSKSIQQHKRNHTSEMKYDQLTSFISFLTSKSSNKPQSNSTQTFENNLNIIQQQYNNISTPGHSESTTSYNPYKYLDSLGEYVLLSETMLKHTFFVNSHHTSLLLQPFFDFLSSIPHSHQTDKNTRQIDAFSFLNWFTLQYFTTAPQIQDLQTLLFSHHTHTHQDTTSNKSEHNQSKTLIKSVNSQVNDTNLFTLIDFPVDILPFPVISQQRTILPNLESQTHSLLKHTDALMKPSKQVVHYPDIKLKSFDYVHKYHLTDPLLHPLQSILANKFNNTTITRPESIKIDMLLVSVNNINDYLDFVRQHHSFTADNSPTMLNQLAPFTQTTTLSKHDSIHTSAHGGAYTLHPRRPSISSTIPLSISSSMATDINNKPNDGVSTSLVQGQSTTHDSINNNKEQQENGDSCDKNNITNTQVKRRIRPSAAAKTSQPHESFKLTDNNVEVTTDKATAQLYQTPSKTAPSSFDSVNNNKTQQSASSPNGNVQLASFRTQLIRIINGFLSFCETDAYDLNLPIIKTLQNLLSTYSTSPQSVLVRSFFRDYLLDVRLSERNSVPLTALLDNTSLSTFIHPRSTLHLFAWAIEKDLIAMGYLLEPKQSFFVSQNGIKSDKIVTTSSSLDGKMQKKIDANNNSNFTPFMSNATNPLTILRTNNYTINELINPFTLRQYITKVTGGSDNIDAHDHDVLNLIHNFTKQVQPLLHIPSDSVNLPFSDPGNPTLLSSPASPHLSAFVTKVWTTHFMIQTQKTINILPHLIQSQLLPLSPDAFYVLSKLRELLLLEFVIGRKMTGVDGNLIVSFLSCLLKVINSPFQSQPIAPSSSTLSLCYNINYGTSNDLNDYYTVAPIWSIFEPVNKGISDYHSKSNQGIDTFASINPQGLSINLLPHSTLTSQLPQQMTNNNEDKNQFHIESDNNNPTHSNSNSLFPGFQQFPMSTSIQANKKVDQITNPNQLLFANPSNPFDLHSHKHISNATTDSFNLFGAQTSSFDPFGPLTSNTTTSFEVNNVDKYPNKTGVVKETESISIDEKAIAVFPGKFDVDFNTLINVSERLTTVAQHILNDYHDCVTLSHIPHYYRQILPPKYPSVTINLIGFHFFSLTLQQSWLQTMFNSSPTIARAFHQGKEMLVTNLIELLTSQHYIEHILGFFSQSFHTRVTHLSLILTHFVRSTRLDNINAFAYDSTMSPEAHLLSTIMLTPSLPYIGTQAYSTTIVTPLINYIKIFISTLLHGVTHQLLHTIMYISQYFLWIQSKQFISVTLSLPLAVQHTTATHSSLATEEQLSQLMYHQCVGLVYKHFKTMLTTTFVQNLLFSPQFRHQHTNLNTMINASNQRNEVIVKTILKKLVTCIEKINHQPIQIEQSPSSNSLSTNDPSPMLTPHTITHAATTTHGLNSLAHAPVAHERAATDDDIETQYRSMAIANETTHLIQPLNQEQDGSDNPKYEQRAMTPPESAPLSQTLSQSSSNTPSSTPRVTIFSHIPTSLVSTQPDRTDKGVQYSEIDMINACKVHHAFIRSIYTSFALYGLISSQHLQVFLSTQEQYSITAMEYKSPTINQELAYHNDDHWSTTGASSIRTENDLINNNKHNIKPSNNHTLPITSLTPYKTDLRQQLFPYLYSFVHAPISDAVPYDATIQDSYATDVDHSYVLPHHFLPLSIIPKNYNRQIQHSMRNGGMIPNVSHLFLSQLGPIVGDKTTEQAINDFVWEHYGSLIAVIKKLDPKTDNINDNITFKTLISFFDGYFSQPAPIHQLSSTKHIALCAIFHYTLNTRFRQKSLITYNGDSDDCGKKVQQSFQQMSKNNSICSLSDFLTLLLNILYNIPHPISLFATVSTTAPVSMWDSSLPSNPNLDHHPSHNPYSYTLQLYTDIISLVNQLGIKVFLPTLSTLLPPQSDTETTNGEKLPTTTVGSNTHTPQFISQFDLSFSAKLNPIQLFSQLFNILPSRYHHALQIEPKPIHYLSLPFASNSTKTNHQFTTNYNPPYQPLLRLDHSLVHSIDLINVLIQSWGIFCSTRQNVNSAQVSLSSILAMKLDMIKIPSNHFLSLVLTDFNLIVINMIQNSSRLQYSENDADVDIRFSKSSTCTSYSDSRLATVIDSSLTLCELLIYGPGSLTTLSGDTIQYINTLVPPHFLHFSSNLSLFINYYGTNLSSYFISQSILQSHPTPIITTRIPHDNNMDNTISDEGVADDMDKITNLNELFHPAQPQFTTTITAFPHHQYTNTPTSVSFDVLTVCEYIFSQLLAIGISIWKVIDVIEIYKQSLQHQKSHQSTTSYQYRLNHIISTILNITTRLSINQYSHPILFNFYLYMIDFINTLKQRVDHLQTKQ